MSNWRETCSDLAPFVEDGVIRVGGRLRKSLLSYEQSFPIVLPASSYISKLILRETHERVYHAGTERTLSESRRKCWILPGRNAAKGVVKNCTV